MFSEWLDYYRHSMSDEAKVVIDPLLRLVQYGFQVPRCIRACICGGFISNDENINSEAFFRDLYKLTDVDMHVSFHPFLLEEYFQNHEEELLEQRFNIIEEIERNNNR